MNFEIQNFLARIRQEQLVFEPASGKKPKPKLSTAKTIDNDRVGCGRKGGVSDFELAVVSCHQVRYWCFRDFQFASTDCFEMVKYFSL